MKILIGTRIDTGKLFYISTKTAEWTYMGKGWWRMVDRQGRMTASAYIQRPEDWVPAVGFKEGEEIQTTGGQLEEEPRR